VYVAYFSGSICLLCCFFLIFLVVTVNEDSLEILVSDMIYYVSSRKLLATCLLVNPSSLYVNYY